ncbi:hypothetical protein ACFFKU_04430 [Kineococcus gynurae]|uniref:Dolichyl-phosphate-mannose-protein mannosyltransferase n=1 Tax=Kineococcus gynurae TaxID=452979 RepID=A0ABV5LRD9_9ACTN
MLDASSPTGAPTPTREEHRWAGLLLTRVPVVLAAVVAAVTVVAVPLVLLDLWRPVVALPVVLVAAVAAGRLAVGVPDVAAPRWAALTCVGIAVAAAVWAGLTHAEHVVLRRDAGSLALYAHHLATVGGLPVDPRLGALGGAAALADPAFTLASPAYYEVGDVVVPQFLMGAPALFSLGAWAAGWTGLLLVPALLGGAAVLAVAGVTARTVGPRWAPLAAATLALAQPVLHANRSTYTEPPALLVFAAACAVLVEALRRVDQPRLAARLGGGAGLLLGAGGFLRIDFLREVALVLPVVAVLLALRHPAARALLAGTALPTVLAALAAVAYSRPYLATISASLLPLVAALVGLAVLSALGVRLARAGVLARTSVLTSARLAPVLTGLFAVVLLVVASRPLWMVTRQDPEDSGAKLVAGLQQNLGLPIDGGRTYAEHSLDWMAWYLGWPAVGLAGVAACVLLHRLVPALQGRAALPAWTAPFVVGVGSTLLTLYRPGITPDHPWADRRFVPLVLPFLVVLATAAVARLAARAPELLARVMPVTSRGLVSSGVSAFGVVLLVLPALLATWPVAGQRTERGEVAAVAQACRAFTEGDVALAVDPRSRNEWPQVLRGTCDVPSASLVIRSSVGAVGSEAYDQALREAVDRAAARIRAAGGRPVLVAAGGVLAPEETLARLGGTEPRQVTDLRTPEDQRVLITRPDGEQWISVDLWTAVAPLPAT